jgi:hypothetical protein
MDKMNGNMLTETVRAEITIKLLANGQVQVTGPLGDKIAMYGLLECAKDVVRLQDAPAEKPMVTPISIVPRFQN